MNNVKLFEQYNREETLLGLAKMGLRTGRREVFDLAIKRGLDLNSNRILLQKYCEHGVYNFNSLEWLYEDKTDYIVDIENIEKLYCDMKDIKKIEGLGKLVNLKHLNCESNNITDLDGLDKLTKLENLYCSNNKITNLKGIDKLKNLRNLVCYYNKITTIEGLEKLSSPIVLQCDDNEITSLKGVEYLPDLNNLFCLRNPLPSDLLAKLEDCYNDDDEAETWKMVDIAVEYYS